MGIFDGDRIALGPLEAMQKKRPHCWERFCPDY